MRATRLFSRWSSVRSLRFRRIPSRRDVVFDPGGATAPRITVPHMLPSTLMTGSASAMLSISRLNLTPQRIAVYASQLSSPTTTQHSLPGGPLRPYPCRSSTGWNAPASPDAPQFGFFDISQSRCAAPAGGVPIWLDQRHASFETGAARPPQDEDVSACRHGV